MNQSLHSSWGKRVFHALIVLSILLSIPAPKVAQAAIKTTEAPKPVHESRDIVFNEFPSAAALPGLSHSIELAAQESIRQPKQAKEVTADPTYYLVPVGGEVRLSHTYEVNEWDAGGISLRAPWSGEVTGLAFDVSKTGNCPILKRMRAEETGGSGFFGLWPNMTEGLGNNTYMVFDSYYQNHGLSAVQIKDLLVPAASVIYQFASPPNNVLTWAGFMVGYSNCQDNVLISNFHWVVYGIPPAIPYDSIFGSGFGDMCFASAYRSAQATVGGPINTNTGGYDYSSDDISISTSAGLLSFQRTYSSLATQVYTTSLGYGWTHNLDSRLIFPGSPGGQEGRILFKAHSANLYHFIDNGDGSFSPYPGLCGSLVRHAGPPVTYTVKDSTQRTYLFDEDGVLTQYTDGQGHALIYEYDSLSGRLVWVRDASTPPRSLTLGYDLSGRITSVTDHAGRSVHFSYDPTSGDLSSSTDLLGQTWEYDYSDPLHPHQLTEVVDPRGVSVERTEYDAQGRGVRQYDSLDQLMLELAYDQDGTTSIRQMTGAGVYTTTHVYDARRTLRIGINALGSSTDLNYDYNFRPAVVTDPLSNTTQLTWGPGGFNLEYISDAMNNTARLAYDELNNLTSLVDRRGFTTTYTYSGTLLLNIEDALGYNTVFTYTTVTDYPQTPGLLKTVRNPLDSLASYTYDAFGQPATATDVLGQTTSFSYDSLGRLVDLIDPLNSVTHYQYDLAGRLERVTRNYVPSRPQNDENLYNIVTQYEYDSVGNTLAITDTLGDAVRYLYDENNRRVQAIDPLGHATHYAYDPAGNLISKSDANGVVTHNEYDALNRLAAVIENYLPGFTADHQTNVRTEYTYDANNNLITIRDANAVLQDVQDLTVFSYDELNRLASVRDPMLNITHYQYDEEGNLETLTDANGAVTQYDYDPLNRLATINYPAPDADVALVYNPVGWLEEMSDGMGATNWSYDELGRIMSVVDPFNDRVSYTYDALGNRQSLTYPDQKTVQYEYDALNRLVQVSDWDNKATAYTYDAMGRLIATSLPGDVTSEYAYDNAGRLLSLIHLQDSTALSSFEYAYDPVGNRRAVRETMVIPDLIHLPLMLKDVEGEEMDGMSAEEGATDSIELEQQLAPYPPPDSEMKEPESAPEVSPGDAYPEPIDKPNDESSFWRQVIDYISRLLANVTPVAVAMNEPSSPTALQPLDVGLNQTTIIYQYDPLQRLTAADYNTGDFFHYSYDAVGNRLGQETHLITTTYSYDSVNRLISANGLSYTWDNNGNLLSDGVSTYTYDHANRLKSVSNQGSTVSFGYNGLGNRLQQTADSVTTNYTLDLNNSLTQVLADSDGNSYLYGLGRIAQYNGLTPSYFLTDALGSVRQLTNAEGWVRLTQSYEPFGSILSNQGDLSISYGFDGEWADATRLTHLRARYYDPSKGRFLTKDPLQGFLSVPQTLNLYSYTRNNPVNRNDPSGYIDDNPQDSRIVGLIITGIILTSAIVTSEVLLTWAETEMIPVIVAQPYVGVPMEAILLTLSVVLIDIDVAYWSYVYRVYQNPNESQCFIWLPPWGLDE